MRSFTLSLIALATPFLLLSQNGKKFSLGLYTQLGVTDALTVNDGTTPGAVEDVIKDLETFRFSQDAGITVAYQFSPRWSASLGLGYANRGWQTKKETLRFAEPEPVAPTDLYFSTVAHYAALPLRIRYNLHRKEHGFYLTGGCNALFSLSNKSIAHEKRGGKWTQKVQDNDLAPINENNLEAVFGFGYETTVKNRIRIFVQPTAQIQSVLYYRDVPLSRRVYGFGLTLGAFI